MFTALAKKFTDNSITKNFNVEATAISTGVEFKTLTDGSFLEKINQVEGETLPAFLDRVERRYDFWTWVARGW